MDFIEVFLKFISSAGTLTALTGIYAALTFFAPAREQIAARENM